MQTVREQEMVSPAGFNSPLSQTPVSANQTKRLKIREFVSWSVCFTVVSLLTGLMKFMKVGVTMESVNSGLFYLSLAGLIYFISRIVVILKNPIRMNHHLRHELN
jgi:hypothetical protein